MTEEQQGESVLSRFKFSNNPVESLGAIKERYECPGCNKQQMHYCYNCNRIMNNATKAIPQLSLPVKIIVLQHHAERKGKNTACHAKIIAPNDVEIYVFPDMPEDLNPTNAIVLYPSPTAQPIDQILAEQKETDFKLKYVVFIDSTWQLSKGILRDSRIQNLPRVKIHQYRTLFWRNQKFDIHFLSTIEAIHYFCREYHQATHNDYNGEYDDLLYLFVHQYELIQQHYRDNKNLTFKTHLRDNYIKY